MRSRRPRPWSWVLRGGAPAVLLGVLLLAQRGAASETSTLQRSEGLTKFYAGQYRDALALFNAAVQADPEDIEARYYRGVTAGRLSVVDPTINLDEAIGDLQTVVARQPDLQQAPLELGILLVRAERYTEALPWLQRAQAVDELSASASLFLALAQYRLTQYDAAQANFRRAAYQEEFRLPSRYYEGLIFYYHREDATQAEDAFRDVVRRDPDSEMGREAAEFLDQLGQPERYELHAATGLEYDSNIVLAPSDESAQAFGVTDKSDGRAVITLGGRYAPWLTPDVQLSLGYDFYQSLYFQDTNYDLQDHRPSAELTGRTAWARFGLLAQYDFDLLDGDSFLNQVAALPWVAVPEAGFGQTELFYRFRTQNYLDTRFQRLDADNNAVGIRQIVYLMGLDRFAWAGFRFDDSTAVRQGQDAFAYTGYRPEIGVGWTFPDFALSTELAYQFYYRDYATASGGRHDDENDVQLSVVRRLNAWLLLRGAYLGTFNDSNQGTYSYDRSIVSLALEARFR